jgi:cell division protein FtsL
MRAFIIFVACLAVLAVGRVAISFAVVQKTVATEAVAREERRVSAENGQLAEKLAELGSTVRIRGIAESKLGLVDAEDVQYLTVGVQAAAEAEGTKP